MKIFSSFNPHIRKEKELLQSVQAMFSSCSHKNKEKNYALFQKNLNKYTRLKDNLYRYDEDNYFGKYRENNHNVNYNLIENNHKSIIKLQKDKNWDYEFIDMCIEDIETELDLLEEYSYDECFEDNLDGYYGRY